LSKELRKKKYDIALVPHRSIRSAVLAFSAQIKNRIGFDTSAGKFLLHEKVQYNSSIHEVKRNLSLLVPLGIEWKDTELPSLYPSEQDREKVNQFFTSNNLQNLSTMVGIAPGTRWNTKRWAKERFAELANVLSRKGIYSILIGGVEDSMLCEEIMVLAGNAKVISSAGKFNVLQSAELIRRCSVLICNDSAPMHLAVAMRTPVVSIFGATIPEFGFAPYGQKDVVIETKGLSCRPCSIHGGDVCPITTFDCMMKITPPMVLEKMATFVNRD
jgi:heptosyltransferase-2